MTNKEARDLLARIEIKEPNEVIINSWWGSFAKDYKEAFDMAIEALEQQACEDAISRQAVNDLVDELARAISDERCYMSRGRSTGRIMQDILDLSSVTPKEKTGHWIENAPEYQNIDPPYICSECGNMHLRKTNYCDQCGTRMVESQESEDKK